LFALTIDESLYLSEDVPEEVTEEPEMDASPAEEVASETPTFE